MTAYISNGRGRPRYVADLDDTEDRTLDYYQKFYDACSAFCYRDVMALSRKLDVTPRTVYGWKYGETFPQRIGIMLQVIDWATQGKPMKLEQPGRQSFSML